MIKVMSLAAFQAELARQPEAVAELSAMSFWRYRHGRLPKAVLWLMRYPALMRALADDAELFSTRPPPASPGRLVDEHRRYCDRGIHAMTPEGSQEASTTHP